MGGTFYAVMGGVRILNATRVDQSGADDGDVIGWGLTNDAILAININSGNKETQPAAYKIRWRESGGVFADLAATGEVKFGATDLVNGDPIAVGGRKCDSQGGDSWQEGYEVEGTAISTSVDLVDEFETELHFSISLADAQNNVLYEFELWDVTQDETKGTCGATLTTEAGPPTIACAIGTLTLTGNQATITSPSDILLDIDHEIDLNGWDGLVSTPTRTAAAALGGSSWGMSIDVVSVTSEYGYAAFSPTGSQIRFGFWFDPNNVSMDSAGDTSEIATIRANIVASACKVGFDYDATYGQRVRLEQWNDSNVRDETAFADLTDEPHWIEVLVTRATNSTSNDGSSQMWVDDVSHGSVTGVDNYDVFPDMDEVRLGIANNNTTSSGTMYFDEFILRNDGTYIGGGEANPTISCSVGTLTLTGNSATITSPAPQTISCSVGVLTLTGNSPSIIVDQVVSCANGVLTLTGNSATITSPPPAQTVTCSVGVLTLTGNASNIIPGPIVVSCSVGTVTLSGNTTTVLKGAVSVSCSVGVLTLTGNSASISSPPPAQTINCSVGVVTLSGQTADVVAGPVTVACSIGILTLTGNPATIVLAGAPQTISCSVGVLTLTGNNASVVPGPVTVSCSVGTLTLTGNQASITSLAGIVVSCSIGSLTLTGNQANVIPGAVTVSCQIASLELQGQTANILPGAVSISCSVGVLTLTGNQASISSATTVSCAVGVLELQGQPVTIIPGAVSVPCQVGVIQLAGQQVDVLPGPVSVACAVGVLSLVGLACTPQIGIPDVKGYVTVDNTPVWNVLTGNYQLYEVSVGNLRVDNVEVDNE